MTDQECKTDGPRLHGFWLFASKWTCWATTRAAGESVTTKFDVIATGTGAAASAVAQPCRAAGWQVA
jgi:hypothetical protein